MKSFVARFRLGALWLLITIAYATNIVVPNAIAPVDFPAFYCAGEALDRGANPYLEMPLGACEQRLSSNTLYREHVVVPAPLPPYGLALWALVARVPFDLAYRLHIFGSLLALAIGSRILAKMTALPALTIFSAGFMLANPSIHNGQPIAFLVLALLLVGYYLRRGNDRIAAGIASMLLIVPHIGIGVCAALFFFKPTTRGAFVVAASALVLVSFFVSDLALWRQYVGSVVPSQATSEAHLLNQYSLTEALTSLGIATDTAVRIASLQYALMLVGGVFVARRAMREDVALLAYVPALFVVIGGSYVHLTQIAFALPAAVVLGTRVKRPALAALVLVALCADWAGWNMTPTAFFIEAAATFTIVWTIVRRLPYALAATAIVALATLSPERFAPQQMPALTIFPIDATQLAEVSWTRFVESIRSSNEAMVFELIVKIPNWLGLIAYALLASGLLPREGRALRAALGDSPRRL